MAKGLPDEQKVYLALKGVLQGQDVHVRQEKKVLRIIQRQQDHADIKPLIQEYGIDNLCQTTKALLRDKIFQSTLQAKKRFPEVFKVSQSQTAERAVSQYEAAKSEDAAILKLTNKGKLLTANQDQPTEIDTQHPIALSNATHSPPPTPTSLYPIYLTFPTQHRLLARLQTLLETACYTFASKHLPHSLRETWTCPESVELNHWPKILSVHQDLFHASSIAALAKPLSDLLFSIVQVRHAAVHRLRLTANRILQFVVDAEALVKLLRDDITLEGVVSIRQCLQTCIGEIERNKDLLEVSMTTTRARFAMKREVLEREEHEALDKMLGEDMEYMILAGRELEVALDGPNAAAEEWKREEVEEDMSEETEIDECGAVGTSGKHSGWFGAA